MMQRTYVRVRLGLAPLETVLRNWLRRTENIWRFRVRSS